MRKKKKNAKKKLNKLDRYIIFSFTVLLTYTGIELTLATLTGISHDTLTTCLYAAFGGEVLAAALIKVFNIRNEDRWDRDFEQIDLEEETNG